MTLSHCNSSHSRVWGIDRVTTSSWITEGFCNFSSSEFASHYKRSGVRAATSRQKNVQVIAAGIGAFSPAQEASVSVAERERLRHLSHLHILELERRRLCCARRRMAPKQGLRKRPAAGSHETFGDLRPGFLLDDATRLDRRAKQAAMEAAARYPTPNGCSISCVCIGQPRVDDEPSPRPEECEPNSKHWRLSERPSHVLLAFKWEIVEGPSTTATEAASCVVTL